MRHTVLRLTLDIPRNRRSNHEIYHPFAAACIHPVARRVHCAADTERGACGRQCSPASRGRTSCGGATRTAAMMDEARIRLGLDPIATAAAPALSGY